MNVFRNGNDEALNKFCETGWEITNKSELPKSGKPLMVNLFTKLRSLVYHLEIIHLLLQSYSNVIQQQLAQRIIENVH